MTSSVLHVADDRPRERGPRHYVMCPPTYFEVGYAINPWMDPHRPVDRALATRQWTDLVEAYRGHGHRVDLLDPVPGLPDMVFTANGATVIDGRVLAARFATPQRAPEARLHADWHLRHGVLYGGTGLREAVEPNEGEGDYAVLDDVVLAGHGFRTTRAAHAELAELTAREVLSLELVDPAFYHLDVALAVLDDAAGAIAYYPPAFSLSSQRLLKSRFPDAILASREDAYAFGLNAVSDGRTVFLQEGAPGLAASLAAAGFSVVTVDLSELIKAGGSVKCCTSEIRAARSLPSVSPEPTTPVLEEL